MARFIAQHRRDPVWYADASCSQTDPEAFFPDKGERIDYAKRVCGRCLVRNLCLQRALDNGEQYGIWGGTTERARRKVDPEKRAAIDDGAARELARLGWTSSVAA